MSEIRKSVYDTIVYEILIREYAGFPGGPVTARTCFCLYLGLSQLDIVVELRQKKAHFDQF